MKSRVEQLEDALLTLTDCIDAWGEYDKHAMLCDNKDMISVLLKISEQLNKETNE